MGERISDRLTRLPGSATLAVSQKARELAAAGRDVISFGAGEPDFPTPEHILAATARAIYDPENHHYTPNAGLPPLREAVAEYTHRFSGRPTDPTEVIVTNGAKQAILNATAAILDPGDEVLLPAPFWVTYPASIELSGGIPVTVPTPSDGGFKVTVDDLESHRTPRTKAMVLVSPSNPTGTVYAAGELSAIGSWAVDNGIWVIADEIYQRLYYEGDVAPSIAEAAPGLETLILINGVAKSYAMTGWRVGWMVAPADLVDAAARHQSHATSNVANVPQQAAIAALTGPQEVVEEMRSAFDRRRKLMLAGVAAIPGVTCQEPAGAFYLFPDVTAVLGDEIATTADLALEIIDKAGVAVVDGESFGAPGHLRLSYALGEDDIERGVARIADLLEGI